MRGDERASVVTPGTDPGPDRVEDIRKTVRRVMVPVDLTVATPHQLRIARGLAEALDVPILVLHVVEPVRATVSALPRLPKVEAERRYRAEQDLKRAIEEMPRASSPSALAYGNRPRDAKVASDRQSGISSWADSLRCAARDGSVTYRVLFLHTARTGPARARRSQPSTRRQSRRLRPITFRACPSGFLVCYRNGAPFP